MSGFGTEVENANALFYADDGQIGSTDPRWLQDSFVFLSDAFRRVGLRTNSDKTKVMTCLPGSI
jgi:hypothetical protein